MEENEAKKKRERISGGAVEEKEMEMGLPGRQRPWTQAGPGRTIRYSSPPSKPSFQSSQTQEPVEAVRMVLPILSALARRAEEEDALRRGSGRLTEIPGNARHPQQRCEAQFHRDMWQDEGGKEDIEEARSPRHARM